MERDIANTHLPEHLVMVQGSTFGTGENDLPGQLRGERPALIDPPYCPWP